MMPASFQVRSTFAAGVDLQIDTLSLVDSIDVEDHSLPPRVNIVMEAGDTNRTAVALD
jgi:hypothetical protein